MRIALLSFSLAAALLARPVHAAVPQTDKIDRPTSAPYTGELSIFEDPRREQKLQVNRVMDLLGLHPGASAADIGAGSGWFSVRAARRVGPRGTVYAIDINPRFVKAIKAQAKREKLPNVRAILSQPDDPLLPSGSVDAVLLLKTYHEIAEPLRLLRHVRAALRPGARLGIIDRNGNGGDHGLDQKKVVAELRRASFSLIATYDS